MNYPRVRMWAELVGFTVGAIILMTMTLAATCVVLGLVVRLFLVAAGIE